MASSSSPSSFASLPAPFSLDLDALSAATVAERGEIFLLNWAKKVNQSLEASGANGKQSTTGTTTGPGGGGGGDDEVEVFDEDTLRTVIQPTLTSLLLRLLISPPPSSSPRPKPGRPLRNILSRSLILLFKKLGPTGLFDFVQVLLRVVEFLGDDLTGNGSIVGVAPSWNDGDGDDSNAPSTSNTGGAGGNGGSTTTTGEGGEAEKEYKVSAIWTLGQLMGDESGLGSEVRGQISGILNASLKIYKNLNQITILRQNSSMLIWKTLKSCGSSLVVGEPLVKDLTKVLKNGMGERNGVGVRGAAECLLTLYTEALPSLLTIPELESLISLTLKAFDSPTSSDHSTRRTLSKLLSGVLHLTQLEGSAAPPEPPPQSKKLKKGKEGTAGALEEEEDEAVVVGAGGGGTKRPTLSGSEPANAIPSSSKLLTPVAMMTLLSNPFNRITTSRKVRSAIIMVYSSLFLSLGPVWVEGCYDEIAKHLIDDIGSGFAAGLGWSGLSNTSTSASNSHTKMVNSIIGTPQSCQTARHDALTVRKQVGLLLRHTIGIRLLSELGQVVAIRELCNLYLSRYPTLMPGSQPPSKQSLLIALEETSCLLRQLGSTPPAVVDVLADPLIRLQGHPSHSVQIYTAWCLRSFCSSSPGRLSPTILHTLELLSKDLSLLLGASPPQDIAKRTIGHARSLASLISLIPQKPLYVSFDVSARCMSLAIQLLKQSGEHELSISSIEIQTTWIIIGALMCLGTNFVRLHLPQLLILWKNALPKPTSKDASSAQIRPDSEWAFLLHIRECTLGCILSFLRNNGPSASSSMTSTTSSSSSGGNSLLTADVSRRLVAMLSNALSFSNSFAQAHSSVTTDQLPSTSSTLKLVDRDLMFRRRIFQCFAALGKNPAVEPVQGTLLSAAVTAFTDPEKYTSATAATAQGGGSNVTVKDHVGSIWDCADGYGFGVTGLIKEDGLKGTQGGSSKPHDWLNRDVIEIRIEELLVSPVLGTAEHDPLVVLTHDWELEIAADSDEDILDAPPCATGLVDSAIELFWLFFPGQDGGQKGSLLSQMTNHLRSPKLEKNSGRRMAVLANCVVANFGALRGLTGRQGQETFSNPQIGNLMRDLIKDGLIHPEQRLRVVASQALGRMCNLAGSSFMASQIQFCVNQVVNNTDPHGRAGCALAFGTIFANVGGMSAGSMLKTIFDVLMSLSSDPHPLVHFWALQSLGTVIDASGLSYSSYVNGTLNMLIRLYMAESHEPEGGSPGTVSLRGNLPAYQAFCRVTDALIRVLGPELQESDRTRDVVLTLLQEFMHEKDEGIAVESIRCMQHFLMFAPSSVDLPKLVQTLRTELSSTRRPLKLAAVNSVYQLVQRNAQVMSKLGGDRLVSDLFALLDDDPSIEGVRDAITSWLKQTAEINPCGWVDLCQRIMSRTAIANPIVEKVKEGNKDPFALNDEESQGLGNADGSQGSGGISGGRTTSRWRTQLFALRCLHEVFLTVARAGRVEHFDWAKAQAMRINPRFVLVSRVTDMIKMAFTASTAHVMDIRLEGLVVLRDVIEYFSISRDNEFQDALLLEQHQAPLTAALTPAFAVDSFPEVLASAIEVCAVFVGSGVVKEIDKMGRILKLLTSALESCREANMTSLGDVKNLSSTAAVMLKTSIFAAWARFETASVQQAYLRNVVQPQIPMLCPFWAASLREYARMRTDPEAAGSDTNSSGAALDSVYTGLTREATLPYYERSWLPILQAVSILLKTKNPQMLAAMDGQDKPTPDIVTKFEHRQDPTLYFFVVFGLAFEVLAVGAPGASTLPSTREVSEVAVQALEALIQPTVAGQALFSNNIFEELCNLAFRLGITEGPNVQIRLNGLMVQLAKNYPTVMNEITELPTTNGGADKLLPTTSRMTQCLRVITCVLQSAVNPASGSVRGPKGQQARAELCQNAFLAYMDISDVYPAALREDLYAILFHFFGQLLKEENPDADVVGPMLPTLKSVCDRALKLKKSEGDIIPRVLQALLSACLQNVDDLTGRQGPAVVLKRKSNLLTATLLLTTLPSQVKISQAAVEHYCSILSNLTISGDPETSMSSIHCTKSIILAAGRGTGNPPVLQFCIGQLLPGLIEYVAQVAESGIHMDRNSVQFSALMEVLKTFEGLLTVVPTGDRGRMLDLILPVFLLLFDPDSESTTNQNPSTIHQGSVAELLVIAGQDAVAFKAAAGNLELEQRTALENAVRGSLNAKGGEDKRIEEKLAPSISLRSFG